MTSFVAVGDGKKEKIEENKKSREGKRWWG